MSQHTRGKWKSLGNAVISKDEKTGIACLEPTPFFWETNTRLPMGREMSANARLISAAPELLEALRECADWLCECHEGTDQWERGQKARAVIRKTEGK